MKFDAVRSIADPIRNGLLFEQSDGLVRLVEAVLNQARIETIDLDNEMGTKSANLLASFHIMHLVLNVEESFLVLPELGCEAFPR